MKTVVVHGGISRDHLVTVGLPAVYGAAGGPGVYAALGSCVAAQYLDRGDGGHRRTVLQAMLPAADADIRALLTGVGVDVSRCLDGTIPKLWILNSAEGRRIVSTAVPSSHELDETDAPAATDVPADADAGANAETVPRDADVLLRSAPVAPLPAGARPGVVLTDPDQRAIADGGWGYLESLAPSTDVYVPSRVQLRQLGTDVSATALRLRARTGRSVVARLDADGSLVLPAAGGAWRVPAAAGDVVETTGAGDSHAGALAAVLDDVDAPALVQATRVASAVAARTLAAIGTAGLVDARPLDAAEVDAIHAHEISLTEKTREVS